MNCWLTSRKVCDLFFILFMFCCLIQIFSVFLGHQGLKLLLEKYNGEHYAIEGIPFTKEYIL